MSLLNKISNKVQQYFCQNAKLSYAQSGEDLILDTIFCHIGRGTYIDVGANNPYVQSNTHFFYRKGWRGINIDALPGSMEIFNKARPEDINIESAICSDDIEMKYYMFKSSFYNTFLENDIEKIRKVSELVGTRNIKTTRLETILDNYTLKSIEFLTIDVEGLDYDVLKSNNWSKYRPKVIVREWFPKGSDDDLTRDNVHIYLKELGYSYFCNSVTNAFYIENLFFKQRFGNS